MLAALARHTDCVHILLEKGAKVDAADNKGFTALHRAVSLFVHMCTQLLTIYLLIHLRHLSSKQNVAQFMSSGCSLLTL